MINTFTGLMVALVNQGIALIVNETMTFRKQLTQRSEFTGQSGWNDALNDYMQKNLERLRETISRVTYSPSGADPAVVKKNRRKQAADTSTTLKAAFDSKSVNADDLVMPASVRARPLTFDFTGDDPNVPQPTPALLPNDFARAFVVGLDAFVVMATQLDSRPQPTTINKAESAQLVAALNSLYVICETKGGEANRIEIPTGILPSDFPSTFNNDGSHDPVVTEKSSG